MFKDQVQAGAALLDEKLFGWEEMIEVDRLNLGSACNCVLGQSGEGYWETLVYLFPNILTDQELYDLAIEHGFNTKNCVDWEYAPLTSEWKQLITERRLTKQS